MALSIFYVQLCCRLPLVDLLQTCERQVRLIGYVWVEGADIAIQYKQHFGLWRNNASHDKDLKCCQFQEGTATADTSVNSYYGWPWRNKAAVGF